MLKFMRFGSLLFSLYCLLPIEVYAQEIKKDSIALSMDSLKIRVIGYSCLPICQAFVRILKRLKRINCQMILFRCIWV